MEKEAGMVIYVCIPSTWEVDPEESEAQIQGLERPVVQNIGAFPEDLEDSLPSTHMMARNYL